MELNNQWEPIGDWIELLKTTYQVYLKLMDSRIRSDRKEYQYYLDCLKMCVEVENSIYERLVVTEDCYDDIMADVSMLSSMLVENSHIRKLISIRISNYMGRSDYVNPFLSMEEDREDAYAENVLAISNQYDRDCLSCLVSFLEKYIQEGDCPISLVKAQYEAFFQYKLFEDLVFKDRFLNPLLKGRENCYLFGQSKEMVDSIFLERSRQILSTSIHNLLNVSFYQNPSRNREFYNLWNEINIETALAVLNENEVAELSRFVYFQWLRGESDTFQNGQLEMVRDIFHKYLEGGKRKILS